MTAYKYQQASNGARNAAIALGLTSASLILSKGKTSLNLSMISKFKTQDIDLLAVRGSLFCIYIPEFVEVLKDQLLNAKTAEVEVESPTESQLATGSSSSDNDASKSEDSRKGFRKRNITSYENKLR